MVSMESSKRITDRSYTNLVEVWDIEKAVLMETFMTRIGSSADAVPDPHELVGVDAETNPAAAIASLVRLRQAGGDLSETTPRLPSRSASISRDPALPSVPAPDIRAFVVGLDFAGHSTLHRSEFSSIVENPSTMRMMAKGFMISGSEDRKLRLWDLGKLERTAILSGMENETERPSYQCVLLSPYSFECEDCFTDITQSLQHWICVYVCGDLAISICYRVAEQSTTAADVIDHAESAKSVEITSGCHHCAGVIRVAFPWRYHQRGPGRCCQSVASRAWRLMLQLWSIYTLYNK